jgi:nitroreductase
MTAIPGALGLTSEQVAGLLDTAGRAPSLHNSQPWRFRPTAQAIELHADRDRAVPVADPDGRELRIACGSALFTLRLAISAHGIRPVVTLLPDHNRPDLLAIVEHGGSTPPTPEQRRLLRAVPARRTDRHPFRDEAVTVPELSALGRAALDEDAWLHIVDEPAQRAALRALVRRAHRTQTADPAFRAEFAGWISPSPGRRDGIPAAAAGALPEPQDAWVLRDFTDGTGRIRIPGKDFEEEPLIAVLTSHLSGRMAEVQVGQALQRVLLTATAAGLATSFLSQVVEVPRTREELRRLIGGTRPPQAVLRIGHGWPIAATPRRPALDMLAADSTTSA